MTAKFGWCLPGGNHKKCPGINGKLVCSCSHHGTGIVPAEVTPAETADAPVIEDDATEDVPLDEETLAERPSRNLETPDGDS